MALGSPPAALLDLLLPEQFSGRGSSPLRDLIPVPRIFHFTHPHMVDVRNSLTLTFPLLSISLEQREERLFPKFSQKYPSTQHKKELDFGIWTLSKLFAHSYDFQTIFIAPISLIFRGMGMELGSLFPWHFPTSHLQHIKTTFPKILESWDGLGWEGSLR